MERHNHLQELGLTSNPEQEGEKPPARPGQRPLIKATNKETSPFAPLFLENIVDRCFAQRFFPTTLRREIQSQLQCNTVTGARAGVS